MSLSLFAGTNSKVLKWWLHSLACLLTLQITSFQLQNSQWLKVYISSEVVLILICCGISEEEKHLNNQKEIFYKEVLGAFWFCLIWRYVLALRTWSSDDTKKVNCALLVLPKVKWIPQSPAWQERFLNNSSVITAYNKLKLEINS